jgi:hypothetical protein
VTGADVEVVAMLLFGVMMVRFLAFLNEFRRGLFMLAPMSSGDADA